MDANKLSVMGCEITASVLGAFSPIAEKNYRQALLLIDSEPARSNMLMFLAMVDVGSKIAKTAALPSKRHLKRRKISKVLPTN